MRDKENLIRNLDGADVFLRNRANAKPAPLNEYDIEAMLDISKICDDAARALEKAIVPPCKIGDDIWYIDYTGTIYKQEKEIRGIMLCDDGKWKVMDRAGEWDEVGTQYAYLSREEAEQALKGGEWK